MITVHIQSDELYFLFLEKRKEFIGKVSIHPFEIKVNPTS